MYEGRAPGLGEARVPSLFLGDNSIPGEIVFASAVRVQNQTENGGGVATEKERDAKDDAFGVDDDVDVDIDGIETSRTSRRGGEETETLKKSIAEDAEETADAQKSTEVDEDGTDGHEGAISSREREEFGNDE